MHKSSLFDRKFKNFSPNIFRYLDIGHSIHCSLFGQTEHSIESNISGIPNNDGIFDASLIIIKIRERNMH